MHLMMIKSFNFSAPTGASNTMTPTHITDTANAIMDRTYKTILTVSLGIVMTILAK